MTQALTKKLNVIPNDVMDDFLRRKIVQKEGIVIDVNAFIAALRRVVDDQLADAPVEEREVMRDHIEMAVYAASSVKTPRKSIDVDAMKEPVRELKEDELSDIGIIGRTNPWAERGDDMRTPAEWVLDYYGQYIPGLLQSHIAETDAKLYAAFTRQASRGRLPVGLDVPSQAENRLRAMPVEERRARKAQRNLWASSMRAHRAKLSPGD